MPCSNEARALQLPKPLAPTACAPPERRPHGEEPPQSSEDSEQPVQMSYFLKQNCWLNEWMSSHTVSAIFQDRETNDSETFSIHSH